MNSFPKAFGRQDVIDFSGDALSPVETLAAGAGVCLEYANLACALINILRPGECSVIIGLRTLAEPKSCHAWIELGGEQYEPQSGKLVSFYGPKHYGRGARYNASRYERLDAKSPCVKWSSFRTPDAHWSTSPEVELRPRSSWVPTYV